MKLSMKKAARAITMAAFLYVTASGCLVAVQPQPAYVEPEPASVVVVSSVPYLVVLPGTYIYVAPDLDMELYFYDGWWWRLDGYYWYRCQTYNGTWVYYSSYPVFYDYVPPDWRVQVSRGVWHGQPWTYQRLQSNEVQSNWSGWKRSKHWEHNNWGGQGHVPKARVYPEHRQHYKNRPPHQPAGQPGRPNQPHAQPGRPNQPHGNQGQPRQPKVRPGQPHGNQGQPHQPQVQPGQPHGNQGQPHQPKVQPGQPHGNQGQPQGQPGQPPKGKKPKKPDSQAQPQGQPQEQPQGQPPQQPKGKGKGKKKNDND